MATHLSELLASVPAARRSLVVRDTGRTIVIPHDEIVWIEAEDYCARLHLRSRSVLVRQSLRSLAGELPRAVFVRVHRSAIANVNAIRSLEPVTSGDQRLILSDGTVLRLSRTHRSEVLEALGNRR